MGRIGCGYVALGGLMAQDPREVKQLWWSYRRGHIAPMGLGLNDMRKIAQLHDWRLDLCEQWKPDNMPTIAEWIRLRKAKLTGRRFVIGTRRHWVGIFLGQAPAIFDTLGGSRRKRVQCVLELYRPKVQRTEGGPPELVKLLRF